MPVNEVVAVHPTAGRRLLIALLGFAIPLCVGNAAPTADPPHIAAGEEYISAAMGGPVHPPEPAPTRRSGEGAGPFKRMVIRGATLVDGTGAPAIGPVDIVIENDKIARIVSVGFPKVPIKESRRPEKGDYEIDASGMYVLPGFINAHDTSPMRIKARSARSRRRNTSTNCGSRTASPQCAKPVPSTGCAGR